MQFIDLKAQQQRIRASLDERLKKVLDHGQYILGPEVGELEAKLAQYCGAKHCVSCASGTDALLMPLMALEVGPGDAVFVPAFTFVATAEVVSLCGATPVFVDVDAKTFNMDCAALEAAVHQTRKKTGLRPRGVIVVDLFGQPADYRELQETAEENQLFVLEDAAQSFGADYFGAKTCSLAPIAATSFFPAKPLGGYGDGGAIFCEDDELASKLLSIRVHGQGEDKYDNVRLGLNGRLDTMQAAILLSKLEVLDEELELRNEVAARYSARLSARYEVPVVSPGRRSSWAQYTLLADDRDEALTRLKKNGIPSAIYYPKPLHKQQVFHTRGLAPCSLEVSERLSQHVFSIPMHPYLSESEQTRVVEALL